MRKAWYKWVAVSALALTLAAPGVAAAEDGMMAAKIDYSKADVMTKDGMELVALRALAESLGYTVTWNEMERSVTLTRGMSGEGMMDKEMKDGGAADKGMTDKSMSGMYKVIIIAIGSTKATVAMKEQTLPNAPVIIDNKTYVTKAFADTYLAYSGMMMDK